MRPHARGRDAAPLVMASPAGRLGRLPRRALLTHRVGDASPPQMHVVAFTASRWRTLGRLLTLTRVLVVAASRIALDAVRGRHSARGRAVHLAAAIQHMGGTLIRVGQRLAIRSDLLQSPYGEEIANLSDVQPPFDVSLAIAAIERVTRRPLHECFSRFDPAPILSTSTACTYQAVLADGTRVVAKVRRPGAGEQLVADLRLVDWMARALEFFAILRRGFTRETRREWRQALIEELDFVREARHQAAFRRSARRSGKSFFSSPRVHFELSGENVIVQEFVSGLWLWELIAAVEQGHEGVLAHARSLGIDPRVVARRLLWVGYWSWYENLFFLAEPNPRTIILGEGGRLSFIDFTSTGAVDHSMKRALQQNMHYALKRDPLNMARATLTLLEPLPPVDPIELTKELEGANLQMLYAFQARPAPGQRLYRSSLLQWRGVLHAAQQFGVAVDYGVLRLIRAALMHENLALRLSPRIDVLREYRRFVRDRADHSADPGGRPAERRSRELFTPKIYLRLEHLAKAGEGFLFRLRHVLSAPRVNFNAMVGKSAFTALTVVSFLTATAQLTAAASLVVVAAQWLAQEPIALRDVLGTVWASRWFRLAVAAVALIHVRKLFFRLDDADV